MKQFCLWSLLLGACIHAQDSLDPAVIQLKAALASNNEAAVGALEQKVMSAHSTLTTLLATGVLLAEHERLKDASAVFAQCAQQYPASFEAKYNLALARIGLTEYPDALAALNSISPVTEDQKAAVQYLTGKIFLATNHLKEAQKSLASAYAQRPNEENYALDLALLYIRSEAYVPAIEVLKPSLASHPASEDLALELAMADALAGRYADGISICRRLQRQDPALSVTRLIAAFSYCTEHDYKDCEDEASAGLASPHAHPYLYYLRARALWDSGASDHAQMLDDLSKAIRQIPECNVCLLLRSSVFEASHDDRSAIADLKKAVEGGTQPASAWYRLSVLYRKLGLLDEASDALQHYRSIHEDESAQEVESFRKQFLDGIQSQTSP